MRSPLGHPSPRPLPSEGRGRTGHSLGGGLSRRESVFLEKCCAMFPESRVSLYSPETRGKPGQVELPNPNGIAACQPWIARNSGIQPLSGLCGLRAITQGRPSRSRSNLGLKDAIPSGINHSSRLIIEPRAISIPPEAARTFRITQGSSQKIRVMTNSAECRYKRTAFASCKWLAT